METYYGKHVLFALHFTHLTENMFISELKTTVAVESEQQLIHEIARNVAHLTRFDWVSSSKITDRYRTKDRDLMGKFEFGNQLVYFSADECSLTHN
nr:hypothetical protein Cplu_594 [Cedratvirus plubellavi]